MISMRLLCTADYLRPEPGENVLLVTPRPNPFAPLAGCVVRTGNLSAKKAQ